MKCAEVVASPECRSWGGASGRGSRCAGSRAPGGGRSAPSTRAPRRSPGHTPATQQPLDPQRNHARLYSKLGTVNIVTLVIKITTATFHNQFNNSHLTPCDRWSLSVLYSPRIASKFRGDLSK